MRRHKLSREQQEELYRLYEKERYTQKVLSEKFKISIPTVQRIIKRIKLGGKRKEK